MNMFLINVIISGGKLVDNPSDRYLDTTFCFYKKVLVMNNSLLFLHINAMS